MPTIRFTSDPKTSSAAVREHGWKAGSIAELSVESCERWIRRNVAEYYTPPPAPVAVATPLAPAATTGQPFDPATAPLETVRAYLGQHNVRSGPSTSEKKLRDTAAELMARAAD